MTLRSDVIFSKEVYIIEQRRFMLSTLKKHLFFKKVKQFKLKRYQFAFVGQRLVMFIQNSIDQVRLTNTTVRLEYLPGVPGLEDQGLALQLHLGKLVYRGQAGQEKNQPRLNFFSFIQNRGLYFLQKLLLHPLLKTCFYPIFEVSVRISFGEMCNMGDVKIKKKFHFLPEHLKLFPH